MALSPSIEPKKGAQTIKGWCRFAMASASAANLFLPIEQMQDCRIVGGANTATARDVLARRRDDGQAVTGAKRPRHDSDESRIKLFEHVRITSAGTAISAESVLWRRFTR